MLSKGQKINNRYDIIKTIGEGGMANVYLAQDTILNRQVAIKVLRGDLENDEKFIRRFQREAKSVSDLSHPNIVEVYDVGEEDNQHYIVMEYIDGKTLKQLVQKRGALTVPEVVDIMIQITDGLNQAHEAYIIHRDIKPQNIMILDNGMIKITDFGIAMSMNATQLTQTNSVMGSVHYLPPEQASGKTATTKSDIYSAGILMYELLTGSVPFKGDNAVEIALKQMKERIPSIRKQNPLIPQSIENIVLKSTAKNPKNRYDSIKQMNEDLINALSPEHQNDMKYEYPYPESELDESKAVPIKQNPSPSSSTNLAPSLESEEEILLKDKRKQKNSKKKMIIITLIIIVIVLMFGTLAFFNYRNQTKEVTVPDVKNMTTEKASELLEKKGFKYDVKTEESDEIEEGKIIKTSPKAGATKKKGSIITLIESSGTKSIIIEDYTNENYNTIEERLKNQGLEVIIDKKSVEAPGDYIGKEDLIIDQSPKYNETEEIKLEKGETITLYIPDVYNEYPDMVDESWNLTDAVDFANKYALTLKVKDKKGKTISDYTDYLDKNIINQSRTGKITSGAILTVTIDADTTTYSLTINYYLKNTTSPVRNTEIKEGIKNGTTDSVTCPGIVGYIAEKPVISYTINGTDATVNCYYTEVNSSTEEENE